MNNSMSDLKHGSANKSSALSGLRVLDFGHYIAGPLASVFLADQGAEVIQIERPGAPVWDENTQKALCRGKKRLKADLKNTADLSKVRELAASCDIIVENFRPGVMDRLGLGYDAIAKINPGVIYLSIPGYSRHDPRADQPAWDSTISAACGFFTDLSVGGAAFNLPPTYTALPLPSVYAGLWAAIAALAALYARQQHGAGDRIEVPLLDAAMSAAAGVIYQVKDQPARYNAPPISRQLLNRIGKIPLPQWCANQVHGVVDRMLPPLFRNYRCADGELLFLCAIDNANHIEKLLEATSLKVEVAALGFAFGNVLDIPPTKNNINAYRGSSRKWRRVMALLAERFATNSAHYWADRLAKAGVPAIKQCSTKEWANMPAMLAYGVLINKDDPAGVRAIQPAPQVDIESQRSSTKDSFSIHKSAKSAGDAWSEPRKFEPKIGTQHELMTLPAPLKGIRVLDLANVIAGPSAGRTLAELGAEVTHISAVNPRMGPRMALLLGMEVNSGKRDLALDLHTPEGQAAIHTLIPGSDVLLYNKLPAQAERMGVAPHQVHAINNKTIVTAVTAFGGFLPGGWEDRPAYDPVIQALSGIMKRFGGDDTPAIHGIASCIDYFTGYAAAFSVLIGLVARSTGDSHITTRTSLVRTAGWVQLPQISNLDQLSPTGLTARGVGAFNRLYRARDGWVHVGRDPRRKIADQLLTDENAIAELTRHIAKRSVDDAIVWLGRQNLLAQRVVSARELRLTASTAEPCGSVMAPVQHSGRISDHQHPAGEAYVCPEASWLRFDKAERRRLDYAPRPGQHSISVLQEAGCSPEHIARLQAAGVLVESWQGLESYLPS